MIYLWGLLAGLGAVACEAMFKEAKTYNDVMLISVPLALLINYSVFRMVQLAPSLPSAFIVFAAVTLSCRISWSVYMGHYIGPFTWAAVGLNVVALGVRHFE